MRATNHKHYGSEKATTEKAPKSRKGVRVFSVLFAVAVAGAALIIPTTTLAPDVDAYEDSKAASLRVGDIDKFASVIKNNCAVVTTSPVTEALTTAAEKTESTNAKKEETKAEKKEETKAEEKETEAQAQESTEEKTEKSETKTEPAEKKTETVAETEEASNDDYDYSDNASGYYTGALMSISNPDPNYSPSYVSLSSYDRAKLERLVMGEAGTMGYYGCALVAQSIRDAMNRSGTSSIDSIISQYQYFGSTSIEPNSDVKNAVSYIFDQNGSAVQHRVLCFYIGYSSWHETQTFITEIGGVRFFDLNC